MGFRHRLSISLLMAAQARILVGGQAVIEGVMMRVPGFWAVAVRDPDGKVHTRREAFTSRVETSRWLKLPVLRGVIHLFESLKIGMATLNWSADIAFPEEAQGEPSKWSTFIANFMGIALAVGLFFVAPLWLTTRLLSIEHSAIGFNLASGGFRIAFFLLYLILLSMMKDVRRLFQYHGAEHKAVYTFEAGRPLTVDDARPFPTQHPRCGTSFLFIVMLAAIVTFALIDTLVMAFIGEMSLGMRLLVHLPLIPLVAGIGYEALKLTARLQHIWFFRWLAQPGLWLQNITTKPPDDDQMSVALESLETAFGDQLSQYQGQSFVADAIA